eukprot:762822-Hanusia_phi.AAC.1
MIPRIPLISSELIFKGLSSEVQEAQFPVTLLATVAVQGRRHQPRRYYETQAFAHGQLYYVTSHARLKSGRIGRTDEALTQTVVYRTVVLALRVPKFETTRSPSNAEAQPLVVY